MNDPVSPYKSYEDNNHQNRQDDFMKKVDNKNKQKQPQKKYRKSVITPKRAPYVFIFPALLLFILFTVYPIIKSLLLSFQKSEGGITTFVGFDNYFRLFQDPLFYQSITNTLLILVIQVPIMIFLALVLANFMNSAMLRMKGFFRVSFFSPAVTSLVSASIIFLLLLNPDYGLINYLISYIGIDSIGWLNDPTWAKISIVLVMVWRWTGYNMIILLAGLQNISEDLYEAARIDGAGPIRQFFSITIPQLKPVILFTVITSTIGTLQLFDEPYNLTGGGPVFSTTTITMYLYQNAFQYFDFEYASAIAYVVVLIISILTLIQFKMGGDKD